MSEVIRFDPKDWDSILKIMDEHGHSKTMYPGTNEKGEEVWISPYPDRVVIKTFQKNGWVRINTFWKDHTVEETFDGRWDKETPAPPEPQCKDCRRGRRK